ncbi:MAG: hypothetical protein R3F59_15070 [Myxococcota bacterium]
MASGSANPVYAVAIVAIVILVGLGVFAGLNMADDGPSIELPEIHTK